MHCFSLVSKPLCSGILLSAKKSFYFIKFWRKWRLGLWSPWHQYSHRHFLGFTCQYYSYTSWISGYNCFLSKWLYLSYDTILFFITNKGWICMEYQKIGSTLQCWFEGTIFSCSCLDLFLQSYILLLLVHLW